MFTVKFFNKLGFEALGNLLESVFCPHHVPDQCLQSFWTEDDNS